MTDAYGRTDKIALVIAVTLRLEKMAAYKLSLYVLQVIFFIMMSENAVKSQSKPIFWLMVASIMAYSTEINWQQFPIVEWLAVNSRYYNLIAFMHFPSSI